jgi:hypothetical protein
LMLPQLTVLRTLALETCMEVVLVVLDMKHLTWQE